ncbi:putative lipoprotein [Campylobacter insulaenigrae]|uniref:TraV family lipoprotein n=1 Tax=Campylobacter insulaenigrae TaxID=260714 RepID=UPI000F6D2F1F|nr:TraV family lipoprotein [Campylobacter insulaenigrae]MCR6591880.1 TraV family lipoprotein [Campylobacter insulaenigrae]MCR6593367.1 TraV family lipoprotein [Campylobacter insulaenigrae]VEJ53250.1 putative lipoprotein [Campylobacter insulaenigrae]
MKNKIFFSTLACAFLFNGCAMLPYKNDFSCEKGKNNGTCDSVSNVYELSHDKEELRRKTIKDKNGKPIVKDQENNDLKKQTKKEDSFYNDDIKNMIDMIEAVEIKNIQNDTPTIFRYTVVMEKSDIHSKNKAIKHKSTILPTKSINENKQVKNQDVKNNQDNQDIKDTQDVKNNQDNQDIKDTQDVKDVKNTQNSSHVKNEDKTIECFSSLKSEKVMLNKEIKVCVYSANIRKNPSCKAKILNIAKKGDGFFALYEQNGWIALDSGGFIHKSIVEVNNEK